MRPAARAGSGCEDVRDVVDDGDDDDDKQNDESLASTDEPGSSKWMTYGDVPLHGYGYCYPDITLLQGHDDVVSWCMDNWINAVSKVNQCVSV